MYADEVWNSICVYGPQPEIDRLKKLCVIRDVTGPTDEPVVDFTALMPESCFGQPYGTWNLISRGPHEFGSFDFGFDNPGECPVEIFERLAEEFPSLAFYCSCMASMDEFMASGWFNGPPGSEKFDYHDVPQDYWEAGGGSQDDEEAVLQHRRLVDELKLAARLALQ